MFGRNNSRSRSRESEHSKTSEEILAEIEIERDMEGNGRDIGGMGERAGSDQSLHLAREITQSHPLGRLLIKNTRDVTSLAKHTNLKEVDSNLNDICREFRNSLALETKRLESMIQENNHRFEMELINKELDSHKINASFKPPTEWGEHPTLTSPLRITTAQKMFPGLGKFKGFPKDGYLSIVEYLTIMRTAQEHCKLSKTEFIERLILTSTGEAHELIAFCHEQGEEIEDIYHSLVMRFDDRITVDEAKIRLQSFKATKGMNLAKVESQIMILANRASAQFPVGESRQAYYNLEACQALIRSLPQNSNITASTTYNSLTARLQKAPTYSFFTRALNAHRSVIDADLRVHGSDAGRFNRFPNKRGNNSARNNYKKRAANYSAYSVSIGAPGAVAVSQTPFKPKPIMAPRGNNELKNNSNNYNSNYVAKARNNYSANRNRNTSYQKPNTSANYTPINRNGKGYRPSTQIPRNKPYMQARRNPNNKPFQKRVYSNNNNRYTPNRAINNSTGRYQNCSLCGYSNHRATDCRNMRDDAGNIKQIIPTMGTCSSCPNHIKTRLHHPPTLCPFRVNGPFANKNN